MRGHNPQKLMLPENARSVAEAWSLGEGTPLGEFAARGVVADHAALLGELEECAREAVAEPELFRLSDVKALGRLRRFAEKGLRRDEAGRLVAPWAGTSTESDA